MSKSKTKDKLPADLVLDIEENDSWENRMENILLAILAELQELNKK